MRRAEVQQAGFDRSERPIIFTSKLKKAHDHLRDQGVVIGPIKQEGGTDLFEVRDPEANVIEICREA